MCVCSTPRRFDLSRSFSSGSTRNFLNVNEWSPCKVERCSLFNSQLKSEGQPCFSSLYRVASPKIFGHEIFSTEGQPCFSPVYRLWLELSRNKNKEVGNLTVIYNYGFFLYIIIYLLIFIFYF